MIAATFVINLPGSDARWQAMQSVLATGALPQPVRWAAVDGSGLAAAAIDALQERGMLARDLSRFDPECRVGEIGCALSHAAVLREVVRRDLPAALILEDDVLLAGDPRDWQSRFRAALAELPADWDIWYLYRCLDIRHRTVRTGRRTVRPWTPLGAAAYAVTRAGARKLLGAIEPVDDAIDRMYVDRAIRPGRVRAYAASPLLIDPGRQPSIINRRDSTRRWVVDGVNRPPEYWPMRYHRHLGESRWRHWPPAKIGLLATGLSFAAAALWMHLR